MQPSVYLSGEPTPFMPVVTQWRRPEEWVPILTSHPPAFFGREGEADGICQAAHFDNRWFISALNIVSANRGQARSTPRAFS